MKNLVLLFSAVMMVFSCGKQANRAWELNSPGKNIKVQIFEVATEGQTSKSLFYQVLYIENGKEDTVILSSPLGIDRKDQQFKENLQFISQSPVKQINESYTMLTGKQKECLDNCNETELTFKNQNGKELQIIFRAYDNGVAFKYKFLEKDSIVYTVQTERTGFRIPLNGKA